MDPLKVVCRFCNAAVGSPCVFITGPNAGKPRVKLGPHAERLADAAVYQNGYDAGIAAGNATWTTTINGYKAQVDDLQSKLTAANQKVTDCTAANNALTANAEKLKAQIADLQAQIADLQNPKATKDVYAHYVFWQHRASAGVIAESLRAGLTGLILETTSTSGPNYTWATPFVRDVLADGRLDIIPCLDTNGIGVGSQTPEVTANAIVGWYKHADGSVVKNPRLSTFKAEGKSVDYWKTVLATLKKALGVDVKFMPLFLSASDANMKAFAPISHTLSVWGPAKPSNIPNLKRLADLAHSLGCEWMEPVRFQDSRKPPQSKYAECYNSTLFRKNWESAISHADSVQMITWNDEAEGTHIWSFPAWGNNLLDLTNYYGTWFKTGKQPVIKEDKVYLSNRGVFVSSLNAMSPTLDGVSVPVDKAEALVFLTAPATIMVNGQNFNAPAGINAYTVDLQTGKQTASIVRNNVTVKSVASADTLTTAAPQTTDALYRIASA
jgi:hypothetical protein